MIWLKPRSTATRSLAVGFKIARPVKLLLAKLTCCREGRRKNQLCIGPVKAFALSSTTSNRVKPSKDDFRRYPDRELLLRASSDKDDGSLGRVPVILLKLRSSLLKLERETMVLGSDPDRKL